MQRVEEDGEWSLMCPAQCPGLAECWGADFEELYTRYEKVVMSWSWFNDFRLAFDIFLIEQCMVI